MLLSVVAHLGGLGVASWLAFVSLSGHELEPHTPRDRQIDVAVLELPAVAEGRLSSDEEHDPRGEPPRPSGGIAVAHIDDGKAGRGGERAGERAEHLADQDDKLRLTTDNQSHLDADQSPRIATGKNRKSLEDRRSSREPMELTFLAQGDLERLERRLVAESDPSRGQRAPSDVPSVVGGKLGASALGDDLTGEVGSSKMGALKAASGGGVLDGREGTEHRESAAVAHARPSVAEAKPSIPSVVKGRPEDTVDSEQKVSSLVHSLVHASVAGGQGGKGSGGTEGGGQAAAGGTSGAGSHTAPLGLGDGGVVDWYSRDPRLFPYLRRIHQKVDPLWVNAFPKSAMFDLKQGTVILEFTVAADGSVRVSWPPVRPSGIDEFDRNCADAIRRAAPFGPIPPELGVTRLKIRAPFEAKNPVVR